MVMGTRTSREICREDSAGKLKEFGLRGKIEQQQAFTCNTASTLDTQFAVSM